FLWGDKNKINVNKETVYAPIEDSGRNLLDIPVRNEVITITWLRSYLNMGPKRPAWAYAADAIIAYHTPSSKENVDITQRTNIFLQTWKTSMARLLADLKTMLKTAQKYNVCLDGLVLSQEICHEMPIWYHTKSKANQRLYNGGEQTKCLKMLHKIRTV
ncbi:hypothetical protein ARMGADRAFT_859928, partial [Armillaria gallica]